MQLGISFQRIKPGPSGGIKAFDTTTLQTGGVPRDANAATDDNVIFVPTRDQNGWPVQRLIVAIACTGAAPVALNIGAFIFDKNLGLWVGPLPQSSTTITPAQSPANAAPVYFDLPAIMDPIVNNANLQKPRQGGMNVCVLVTDPGAAVNGTYTIAVGADLGIKSY